MGTAQVVGVRFLDADGQVLVVNGGNLGAWQALRWMKRSASGELPDRSSM
ncbi:hypothetical protein ACNKHR_04685 [Shigella flexneri]